MADSRESAFLFNLVWSWIDSVCFGSDKESAMASTVSLSNGGEGTVDFEGDGFFFRMLEAGLVAGGIFSSCKLMDSIVITFGGLVFGSLGFLVPGRGFCIGNSGVCGCLNSALRGSAVTCFASDPICISSSADFAGDFGVRATATGFPSSSIPSWFKILIVHS